MTFSLAVSRTLLRLGLSLLAATMPVLACAGITDDINDIERAHGAESDVVISKIAGLEAAARKSGGSDLRVFLAAWGYAHAMTGGRGVAEAAASELEDLGIRTKDNETLAAAYTLRANILELQGRSRIARDWVAKAMPLALRSSDLSLRYWVATTAGFSAYESGALEEALAMFQSALTAAEESKDERRQAQTHINMVSLLLTLKDAAGAMRHAETAFRFAQAGKQHGLAAQAKALEAVAAEALGDVEHQRTATEASIALSKDVGGPVAQLGVLLNLSDLNLRAHNFAAARAQGEQALALARTLKDEPGEATAQLNLGFALIGLGKVMEGRRIAEQGVAYYRKIDSKSDVLSTLNQYGEILERAGDAKHALQVVREAQAIEDEMLRGDRQRTVVEMQQRYEAEKRSKEIELLNRDNALKTAELGRQQMARRSSWLLAVVLALASIVAILLYGRVRRANQQLAAKNADLEFMSKHDPLTGLFNRRHFTGLLEAMPPELPHRREEDSADLVRAVFLLDIDHFKQINDNFGHRDGDAVLVEVARRLREALRDSETVVRWGGEEFLVLAPAIRRAHLDELATRLLRTVGGAPIATYGETLRVTTSIGYSPLELPGDPSAPDWERALHRADLALFLAKRRGRNQAIGVCAFRDAEAIEQSDEAAQPPSILGPAAG